MIKERNTNHQSQIRSGSYYWWTGRSRPTNFEKVALGTIPVTLGHATYDMSTVNPNKKMEVLKYWLCSNNYPVADLTAPIFVKLTIDGISNQAIEQPFDLGDSKQKEAFLFFGPAYKDPLTNRYTWSYSSERIPELKADVLSGDIIFNFSFHDPLNKLEIPLLIPGAYQSYVFGMRIS